MAETLLNPGWYRIANLTPRLRDHAQIHRQMFRGDVWYVLQDHQSGRYHRLSPAANLMLSLMDGKRTLDDIWLICGSKFADEPPTQGDVIRLLGQLHANDLLRGDVPPDFAELAQRARDARKQELMGRLKNPLALRLPLFNPDRLLDWLMPFFKPLISFWGLLAWAALCVAGIVTAALHWTELTGGSADQLISAGNIVLILLTYPVLKLLHELGHAVMTKAFGGHVYETGVMLLVFMPAPYVDATSATAFPSKWQRIAVSAAGIMVEFGLASLAMIFWANAEPGFARAMAFNVVLIGSVSTLFFNGNPLLRFDAFYMLMDWVEIPNLASRANRYFFYLVQRYILGLKDAESPVTAKGEEKWLFSYAVLSWMYRTFLSLTIALLVATKFFFVGLLLAGLVLYGIFVGPVVKAAKFVTTSHLVRPNRRRVFWTCTLGLAALVGIGGMLPLPYGSTVEAVVMPPEGAEHRAATTGEITDILAPIGSFVTAGTPLIRIEDRVLDAEIALLEVQRAGTAMQRDAVLYSDRVRAGVLSEQLRNTEANLALALEKRDALVVTASRDGTFLMPEGQDMIGRHARQGQLLAYVVGEGLLPVRAVVPQSRIELVRADTNSASLRYRTTGDGINPVSKARILREVPAAQDNLPSLALGRDAGGTIVTSQAGGNGPRALEGLFIFDLAPENAIDKSHIGARVDVRFAHSPTPLATRAIRNLRQLFLSYFNV